jgi:tRNA threonylcarbamoyladenosine biosynthesis protein TsaB
MLILGIETATIQVGCAIGGHEGVLASFHAAKGRRHVETLIPAVEFMCHHAKIDLDEISVVAVDVGPGLFSGLRVGVAAAKALAQALRVPTIGISSLDLLAFPVR